MDAVPVLAVLLAVAVLWQFRSLILLGRENDDLRSRLRDTSLLLDTCRQRVEHLLAKEPKHGQKKKG